MWTPDRHTPRAWLEPETERVMVIIYVVAALYGAALTAASLWPFGILTALAAAPIGGSAVVMLAALLLVGLSTHHGKSRLCPGSIRPSA